MAENEVSETDGPQG